MEISDANTDYKALTKAVQERLAPLSQRLKKERIPAVIIFEGWGASGKGAVIAKLIEELDPRNFKVYTTGAPSSDEIRFPLIRRFWTKIPEYGNMSIFDRSWYRDVSISAVEDKIDGAELDRRVYDILDFERMLADDGYVLLKFFLKITKEEQKKRFEKLEADRAARWRVTEDDWRRHKLYSKYKRAFGEMIELTGRLYAPWTEIEAGDAKKATYEVCAKVEQTLLAALNKKLSAAASISAALPPENGEIKLLPSRALSEYDLSSKLEDGIYKEELKKTHERLFELHNMLYRKKIPLIVVYEGWDAAGKGGNIHRLTAGLDPRGYEVIPVSAPSPPELNRHYLWRFWNSLPKSGHIAIYDRSWYGRVMVERIEGFCTEEQWKRAYGELNRFELTLNRWGAIIIKLWLHIDRNEQLARFNERQENPEKLWKITDEDWRNREKWSLYEEAANDMLRLTNTEYAPWAVVASNDKKYARIAALKTIIAHIENNT